MGAELPESVITELRFIGRESGMVKSLSGFRKKQHTLPSAANATTQAFLARLCAAELRERGEGLFQAARDALGYKRREISLSIDGPQALLRTRDFALEIAYALDPASPSDYCVTQTLCEAREAALLTGEPFNALFRAAFTELSFALKRGVQVEAVIDAVEALEGSAPGTTPAAGTAANGTAASANQSAPRAAPAALMRVSYPSDCSECEIAVEGVATRVRCNGASIDLIFPRGGAPVELLREFAAVRSAFQLSPELASLVG